MKRWEVQKGQEDLWKWPFRAIAILIIAAASMIHSEISWNNGYKQGEQKAQDIIAQHQKEMKAYGVCGWAKKVAASGECQREYLKE